MVDPSPVERPDPAWDAEMNIEDALWSETLPVGLFIVSEREEILFLNLHLLNLLDVREGEMQGQSYHTLFQVFVERALSPEIVSGSLDSAVLSIKNNPTVGITLRGNPHRHVEISLFPTSQAEGGSAAWGGVVQDRTQEVNRLTGKTKLVAEITRMFRKRLASLQGELRALSDHHLDWDADMVRDLFQSLQEGFGQISGQVDQALNLLRLQNDGIVVYPEAADLADLIQGLLEKISVRHPALETRYTSDGELPLVRVDPAKVEEALQEIIHTIGKGTDTSGRVHIRTALTGNWVQVCLHGPPHPERRSLPEELETPSKEESELLERMGISQSVIPAHGGKVWVETREDDQALKVCFTLPVMPVQRTIRLREQHAEEALESGTILVADSDPDQLSLLTSVLREEGYQVRAASDGPAIIDIAQVSTPDLILLEWDLKGMSGLSATKYIRRWSSIPIFMLTSKTNPENMIDAFDAGVDDFLTKPFLVDEVLIRIKALLRRDHGGQVLSEEDVFERRGLRINFDTQRVWKRGKPVELTPTEYKILAYMASHRRQVLPYRQLIEHAWEATEKGSRRGLFVHISRLRSKLEDDPEHPQFIVTRWGVGYIFMPG